MLGLGCSAAASAAAPKQQPRAILNFRDGWRFSRTDTHADSLDGGCPDDDGQHQQPCQPGFDDAGWRALSIPHDFVVEAPLVPSEDSVAKKQGYRDYSQAWYRLKFSVPAEWSQRSLWLDFDGIAGYVCVAWCGLAVNGSEPTHVRMLTNPLLSTNTATPPPS